MPAPVATILPPPSCDAEVAAIMAELSNLQTFLVLHGAMPGGANFIAASDLVQRTRCLIVERCFTKGTRP